MAPYLVSVAATLAIVLLVSFLRVHRVIATAAVIGFVIVLASIVPALDGGVRDVGPLFRFDGFAAFFNVLFLLVAIVTALNAYPYLERRAGYSEEFYVLLGTATLGAMVLAGAQHFASLLLGLEILAISMYTLIAYPEEGHPPLEAALKYLILSGVASTTLLFGMALVYNATGSLAFADVNLAVVDPALGERARIWHSAGIVLMLVGLAFKLSLIPLHMWTADVYQGAPAVVTGYLATVSKAAAFAVLLRFATLSGVLDEAYVFNVVAVFAILSMVLGNLLALLQQNVKRILAYSSIAHAGYLMIALLAVGAGDDPAFGAEAALVFLAGYVLMTLAAFTVVGAIEDDTPRSGTLALVHGLFWRRPLLAFALAAALLSLAGIPLTAGFIAKFYMFAAGVEGALWNLVWAMIAGSAVGIYYYLKIVFAMTNPPSGDAAPVPFAGTVTGLALGFTIVVVGTYPTPLIEAVRSMLE